MGWAILSAPGTEHGPCKGKCQHIDCAATRKMADNICGYCDKPIGFDQRFYQLELDGEQCFAHAPCAEREEDILRKAMKRSTL